MNCRSQKFRRWQCLNENSALRNQVNELTGIFRSFSSRDRVCSFTMWQLSISWWELILRVVIIYAFLLVLLRLSGKRQVGQLAPFDLVLLLVLSNSVQNAMNGGDNSVLAGLISAGTLVLVNYLVGLATYKSKRLEALIEGRPEVLIHNGKLFTEVMEREKLTHHELNTALRAAGCACIEEVHFAILENNGVISVQPRKERTTQ